MKNTIITLASVVALASAANAQTYMANWNKDWNGTDHTNFADGEGAGGLGAWSIYKQGGVLAGSTNGFAKIPSGTFGLTEHTKDADGTWYGMRWTANSTVSISGLAYAVDDGADGNDLVYSVGNNLPFATGNITVADGVNIGVQNIAGTYTLNAGDQVIFNALPNVGLGTNTQNISFSVTAVPEPSSTALLGLGALGLLIRRKR